MSSSTDATPTEGSRHDPQPTPIEPIMEEVRLAVRDALGWGAGKDAEVYDTLKTVYQGGRPGLPPGPPFHGQILGPEEDWEVPIPLSWETHRGRIGAAMIWVKKRVFFPLNRWLFSYVWHNLHRQQRLNLRLLSAVEALAASNGRLRHEVEGLRRQVGGQGTEDQASVVPAFAASAAGASKALNLAFVVDRYGPDVPGGSERHCREFAERLATRGHTVTVLTSCARDYVSWANAFPPGPAMDGPVRVLRFPVHAERDPAFWHAQSRLVFSGAGSTEDERRWFQESGPYVPALIDHLRDHPRAHDLFIFFSYRYYPTFAGLPLVAPRAILVPTAEEDPAIRLEVVREFFSLPLGIVQNTVEEEALMKSVTKGAYPPSAVIGSGVDEAGPPGPDELITLGVRRPYLLCLGRVDPNKGSLELLSHFQRYRRQGEDPLQLVLAGDAVVRPDAQADVVQLGRVSEKQRAALLSNMVALVAPSPFESLSLALLEAWMHGRPALVNGQCRVLKGQVRRAEGGLYYDNAAEFREALRYFIQHPDIATRLGEQGRDYARREYGWPVVMERLEAFLQARFAAVTPR